MFANFTDTETDMLMGDWEHPEQLKKVSDLMENILTYNQ